MICKQRFRNQAIRDCITQVKLWEMQSGGPTWIWYGLHNWQRITMVKSFLQRELILASWLDKDICKEV